jgi:hypothetical protein
MLQVVMNVTRKSTVGWSIQNVLLDFTGGTMSVLQLVLQCAVTNDFTQIAGNPVKFGLGFVSLSFDVVFMIQHYVIYRKPARHGEQLTFEQQAEGDGVDHSEQRGLLDGREQDLS